MAKETKDQRIARLAQERAAEENASKAYFASLPKRLFDAQALAVSLGVSCKVDLGPHGPIIHFEYENEKYQVFIDETLTYQSEEWVVSSFDSQLENLKSQINAEQHRFSVAKAVWATLTENDRRCLKEFIFQLS